MALGMSVQMRQIQAPAMTPRLVRSIRLLQFSRAQLLDYVEEQVEKNPLLELERTGSFAPCVEGPGIGAGARHDPDRTPARAPSLGEHVFGQIDCVFRDRRERRIAVEIASHLDGAGYLRFNPEETARRLKTDPAAIEAVLARLRDFDPAGVFARSLGECLGLQLRRKGRLDPAMAVLLANLDLLARRDFRALAVRCGVDEARLADMRAEIRALDPKPGARFACDPLPAVVADVNVRRANGAWRVELNRESLVKVRVNDIRTPAGTGGQEAGAWLDGCRRDARWLTRSLERRAGTILKIAGEIVHRQRGFLSHGDACLRPLTLRTVAEAIGAHESTVSRGVSGKFVSTPRGLFEMRFFFTVAVPAAGGGQCHSASAARHRIRRMIAAEAADGVLSDAAIADNLEREGVAIARRTVAKYREAMGFASSFERRREKRFYARARASRGDCIDFSVSPG